MRLLRWPLRTAALASLSLAAQAQGTEALREIFRQVLDETHYSAYVTSLVDLSGENELSAANYSVDDGVGTELSTLKLPFRTTLEREGEDDGEGVYLEGNLGYLTATVDSVDFFEGLPELETNVKADWTVYSGLAGAGWTFQLAEGLHVSPYFDLLLAYVQSDASYAGTGVDNTAPVLDGLFFNWNAWVLTYGPGARLDWKTPISEKVALETVARIDLRRSTTLHSTDPVQGDPVNSQRYTLRGDFTGPTSFRIADRNVRWRGTLGLAWFPGETGDALGFDSLYSIGGALELPLPGSVPVVSELTLSGAWIWGPDVTGWTVGLGASL